MSRVLISLRKGEEVKYLSHLDFMRAFEYALRRAGLPVLFSEGFNPRPRMSFASALGVGVTSDDEQIILELTSAVDPSEVMEKLNAKLPKGMQILSAEVVREGVKSPISGLNATRYRITAECPQECDAAAVRGAAEKLLASDKIRVLREREGRTKEIDIRPFILSVDSISSEDHRVIIEVSLESGSSGGARPQDFMQALGDLLPGLKTCHIHKLKHFHKPVAA